MRIAYVFNTYPRATQTFLRTEVTNLRALGHDVRTFSVHASDASTLLTDEARSAHTTTVMLLAGSRAQVVAALVVAAASAAVRTPRRFRRAGRLALEAGWPGLRGRITPMAYLAHGLLLAHRWREDDVEHVHAHFGVTATVAMIAAVLADLPFSVTYHGAPEFDDPRTLGLAQKAREAAFLVGISNWTRNEILRYSAPADWPKVEVVRCAAGDHVGVLCRDSIPSAPRVACVGRLAPQKGHHLLIDAVAALKAEGVDIEVDVIGDGPMRRSIEVALARRGVGDRIRLLGWVDEETLRATVCGARALVMPSLAEGLPVAIIEALSMGRPVIATSVGGIPELVEDGVNGWLVPPASAAGLVRALRDCVSASPARLAELGASGARRVEERHRGLKETALLAELFAHARRHAACDAARALER